MWQKFKIGGFEEDQDPKQRIEDVQQKSFQQRGHVPNGHLPTDRGKEETENQANSFGPNLGLPPLSFLLLCVCVGGGGSTVIKSPTKTPPCLFYKVAEAAD